MMRSAPAPAGRPRSIAIVIVCALLLGGCGAPAPASQSPPSPAAATVSAAPATAVPSMPPTSASTASSPSPSSQASPAGTSTPVYSYTIVKTYPHDRASFTEGLVYSEGMFYEGTGEIGRSRLLKTRLDTGEILQSQTLEGDYFGEGITLFQGQIYQLTWRSQTGFVYRADTLQRTKTFTYTTEGWGLTHDDSRLIMSDGTDTLYTLDPQTLEQRPLVKVADEHGPVTNLNELEYIDGQIYANVWLTDRIARIDPHSGRVTAWIDLSGLVGPEERVNADAVLNGIAYDPAGRRLFVTGKLWSKLFEITLAPKT